METKIKEILSQYNFPNENELIDNLSVIQNTKVIENKNSDVFKTMFSCIDLTSLSTTDNEESIEKFTQRVNSFGEEFPELENVAAICVYPSLTRVVRETLTEGVEIAAVAGGFPHSQTFTEVKIAETALAVLDGASEIDIVISVGKLLEKKYDEIIEEIQEIKAACKEAHLKVIIESGALNIENICIASILSMEAGADFIKTSTGKQQPAATPIAAWCMCDMISQFYKLSGRKVGFKAAGGISTTDEALFYYSIVKEKLGEDWLNKEYFRFGASKLANNILSDILEKETKYF